MVKARLATSEVAPGTSGGLFCGVAVDSGGGRPTRRGPGQAGCGALFGDGRRPRWAGPCWRRRRGGGVR